MPQINDNTPVSDIREIFSSDNATVKEIMKRIRDYEKSKFNSNSDSQKYWGAVLCDLLFYAILYDRTYYNKYRWEDGTEHPTMEQCIGKCYYARLTTGYVNINRPNDEQLTESGNKLIQLMNGKINGNTLGQVKEDIKALKIKISGVPVPQDFIMSNWVLYLDGACSVIEGVVYSLETLPSYIVKKMNGIEARIHEAIEKKKKFIVLTGAPGTGKTYSSEKYAQKMTQNDKGRYKLVQFHGSYDYTDFVEGLKPVSIDGQSTFVRMDGTFKAFCRKAAEHSDETLYYFIIDEINRADLSRVFGELMLVVEDSKRGEIKVDTQYQYLPTYEVNTETGRAELIEDDIFKDGFFVPKNVIIIATMNDIDRNVETIDFALRRRFHWIEIKAEEVMDEILRGLVYPEISNIVENSKKEPRLLRRYPELSEDPNLAETFFSKLKEQITDMNEVISYGKGAELGLNEQYHIGAAYFGSYTEYDSNGDFFDTELAPILREYVRGRNLRDVKNFVDACRDKFVAPNTANSFFEIKTFDIDNVDYDDDVPL